MSPTTNNPFDGSGGIALFSSTHPVQAGVFTASTYDPNGVMRPFEQEIVYHLYNCEKCGFENTHHKNETSNFCKLCNAEHNVNHE